MDLAFLVVPSETGADCAKVRRFEPSRVFMAKDFLDIVTRGTVDMTLTALVRDCVIRRIRRGLYDVPKVNPDLGGTLSPDIDQAARALARGLIAGPQSKSPPLA